MHRELLLALIQILMWFKSPSKQTQHITDKRGLSSIATIFVVFIVIAVGVAAYLQWGSAATGSAPSTDEVISAHQSVDSFQYDASLTAEAQLNPSELEARSDVKRLQQVLQYIPNTPDQGFPESLTAEFTLSGGVEFASSTVRQAQSDISFSAGTDQREEMLAVSVRKTEQGQYLRAQTLPEIGFFPLNQFEGQWYSASSTDATQLGAINVSSQLPAGVPADVSLSAQTTRELMQAMFSSGVLTIEDKIRTELRSGAPAWRFQLGVNPQKANTYRQAAQDIIRKNHPELVDTALFATSSDATDLQASLSQFDNRIDEFSVWIDRNSDRIRRLVATSQLDKSELEALSQNQAQLSGVSSVTITFDLSLSAYNQSVNVQTPENAQPLKSVFGGGMMMPGGATQPSSNAQNQPIRY